MFYARLLTILDDKELVVIFAVSSPPEMLSLLWLLILLGLLLQNVEDLLVTSTFMLSELGALYPYLPLLIASV
jgi:hypothetical protein